MIALNPVFVGPGGWPTALAEGLVILAVAMETTLVSCSLPEPPTYLRTTNNFKIFIFPRNRLNYMWS